MRKYYTRACNFYHGKIATKLIKSKKALCLTGRKDLAFDNIEIFIRSKKNIKTKIIHIKDIKNLNIKIKKIITKDIKKITAKRKNFLRLIS